MLYGINELYRVVDSIKPDAGKCYYQHGAENACYVDDSSEVPLIRFTPFRKHSWLSLGFSTRLGGVSKGRFASLNLGFNRGDDKENVIENYKRVCKAMNGNYKDLVLSDQVHDTKVMYVDKTYVAGEKIEKRLSGIDGMVTDVPGIMLATSYADCVPLFFADPVKKVIASSHSGWRGTVGFIGSKTVKKMEEQFGSSPGDIECIIGPSVCQGCYEVSGDVINRIKKAYPENTWKDIFYCKNTKEKKYQLDLWAANFHQLLLAGLKKENIHISGLCTCCSNMVLFSHRASGGKRGNLNGFIMINET
ncbi:MAG: peptidoglycan editing factor PgeF [Lachnospiraceae bacterium]